MHKKAQFQNYTAAIILLFMFGFFSIFFTMIYGYFIDSYTAAGLYTGETAQAGNAFLATFYLFDKLIVLVLIATVIGLIVTTIRIATAPIFFIVTLLFGIFFGVVSYFFNYIFISLISPSLFDATKAAFPYTLIICTNLHWVMLLYIVVGSITLYAKRQQGQEGGDTLG